MSDIIELYTIGFTKKTAEKFFEKLANANVTRVIDVRLNNVSQLAGFAKRDDLAFFLKNICNCKYLHLPDFAPTKDILDLYKKKKIGWDEYEKRFEELMTERAIENELSLNQLDRSCLLCSEATADHCHRRLVAEYLQRRLGQMKITHL